jgi:protoheme IX farnesyltransferase
MFDRRDRSLRGYITIVKPRMVTLFLFTAIGGVVVAAKSNIPMLIFALVLIAVGLGTSGANAVTSYFDKDVDAMMKRTQNRPLPTGIIIPPKRALYYGLILFIFSMIVSLMINLWVAFVGLIGFLDNVLVYSKWLKRKNQVNIILGGFSGGAPVLAGYVAINNSLDVTALLMAALVVLWIPTHIWSYAIRYSDDYREAKIPMLPVVVGFKKTTRCILSTSILFAILSILLYYVGNFGSIYLTTALLTGLAIVLTNIWFIINPSIRHAFLVFKFSSPYLVIIFSAMIIDVLLHN